MNLADGLMTRPQDWFNEWCQASLQDVVDASERFAKASSGDVVRHALAVAYHAAHTFRRAVTIDRDEHGNWSFRYEPTLPPIDMHLENVEIRK